MNLEKYATGIEMKVNDTRAMLLLKMVHVMFGKLQSEGVNM